MRERTFGDLIRDARKAKSRGLCELARELNIAPSYLSDIEHDRRVPSEDVLRRIAPLLDLDVDDLLAAAGRFGQDAERYMKRTPSVGMLVRLIAAERLSEEDVQELLKVAVGLGKDKRKKK